MSTTLATYLINGSSPASLNITTATLTLNNRAPSVLDLTIIQETASSENPFSYRDTITVSQNGTTIYNGKVKDIRTNRNAPRTSWRITAYDGLDDLDAITLQNTVKSYNPVTESLDSVEVPRVYIGQSDTGTFQTTGQVITGIVNYAISKGAHLSLGTILTGRQVPPTEVVDTTAGTALQNILRYHPDAHLWVDGQKRLQLQATSSLDQVSIDPDTDCIPTESHWTREDRAPKGVKIVYEITHTIDGETLMERQIETAGATSGWPPPLAITIELAGAEVGTQEFTARTRTLPTDDTLTEDGSKNFIKGLWPQLAAADNIDLTINSVEITPTNPYEDYINDQDEIVESAKEWEAPTVSEHPRMLLSALPPWLRQSMHPAVITVQVEYSGDNAPINNLATDGTLDLSAIITLTDAEPKTYRGDGSVIAGESPLEGLAADYYAEISTPKVQGTLSGPATGELLNARPGYRVTLPSENPTPVQSTTIDLINRTISAQIGLGEHLAPQDTIELQRTINANKPRWPSAGQRTQASVEGHRVFKSPESTTPPATLITPASSYKRLWTIQDTTAAESLTTTFELKNPGTIREDTDLDSAITISDIDSEFTATSGHILRIKHTYNTSGTRTASTLELGSTWTDYPSPWATQTVGSTEQIQYFYQPIAKIVATSSAPTSGYDTVTLANDLTAILLSPSEHFLLIDTLAEIDSDILQVVDAQVATADIP